MGERGPAPARSEERRRTNEPAHPIWKLGPEQLKQLPFEIDLSPSPPPAPSKNAAAAWKVENADSGWCERVVGLYEGIKTDPMVAWMTSADWQMVMVMLDDLDRELKPQVVGTTELRYDPTLEEMVGGDPVYAIVPVKAAKMSAIVSMMKAFGIGEANRLRMQKEVQLFTAERSTVQADESDIVDTRLELLQGGQA